MWDFVALALVMGLLLAGTTVIIRVGLLWDERRRERGGEDDTAE